MHEPQKPPLVKAVPGHLLQFEETIFGMSLTQFLSDLGAGGCILVMTDSLPLILRMVICLFLMGCALLLIHGSINGTPILSSLWYSLRSRFLLPVHTVWRPVQQKALKGEESSIQEHWIQWNALDQTIAGFHAHRRTHKGPLQTTYWAIFEVASLHHTRLLTEGDQVRLYERLKVFLDGLGFPLQFISIVEPSDVERETSLLDQRHMLAHLENTRNIQRLQQASITHQLKSLQRCTMTRHFVIVSASTADLLRVRTHTQSHALVHYLRFLLPQKHTTIPPTQVKQELHIRLSILQKAFSHLDVEATLLKDAAVLDAYTSCLTLGARRPPFDVRVLQERAPQHQQWEKRIQGLHRSFVYHSDTPKAQIESEHIGIAEVIAPSTITVQKDAIEVTISGKTRYQRYYEVTGFASELTCGWLEELTTLSLPMIIISHCHPIDSRFMVKKLELHSTKLESQKLADQRALRLTRSDHHVELEQVRSVIDALARKKMTIFSVQMIIGIHASDPQRLEQRADYLLSHLRDLQLRVRPLTRRQDLAWQASLPGNSTRLDTSTNLPSDVLSTCINWSRGTIGTPTGAYIGTTGSDLARRPVYFNPWDAQARLPNPHVVICGESGMGKSWLAKTLVMGLLCTHTADAVVLDRDGDYDAIHEYLQGESQRFNLAGASPINLLDIPFGPDDVHPDDPIDLLAEFIDNHLLVGLALLYGEPFTTSQEAFLAHAARAAYATKGITYESIRHDPHTLLLDPPLFADLLAAIRHEAVTSESLRQTLLERFTHVAYLFPGPTTIKITCPLTIFNIQTLDEKWYPLMMYVIHAFLQRHRMLRSDERYLAYVIEEASYMLKHPAGKRYLENGSRGFRKRGIAQFTLSQHPDDFLHDGSVIIANAGTCFFLGMQPQTARTLHLAEELERVLAEGVPGRAIMRCGRAYAEVAIAKQSALHQAIFTTDPRERRLLRTHHKGQLRGLSHE